MTIEHIDAKNLIAGHEVDTPQRHSVYAPAWPEKTIGSIPRSTAEDIDDAVQAAVEASHEWKRMGTMARGQILFQAAEVLTHHADELAQLASLEMGKPIAEARGEALRAAAILRYFGGEGARPMGEVIPSSNPNALQYTTREPLGVVGIITPWNFPLAIPMWKIAPALVYGNTVVCKPAELSSLTAYRMLSLLQPLLPAGVLNVVAGLGREVGQALVQHSKLQGISFTGSSMVGAGIASIAAARGMKYQLEMGGKNPVIIADDANLELAVEWTVSGAMRSAGQKCTATSRAIVMPGIRRAFSEALVARVRELAMGDPLDPDTYVGPLVSDTQRQKVQGFIDGAQASGYRLLVGDRTHDQPGFFVSPTVFDEVGPDATIAQEEIFGPVVAIIPASTLEEAIHIANGVRFGLSASVFTQSLSTAMHVVQSLDVGMVRVNQETAGVEYQAPFGGVKASSSHSREQGQAAADFYTETKTVAIQGM